MPNYDYVFVATGLPPADVASLLGDRIGAESGINMVGVPFLSRPGAR